MKLTLTLYEHDQFAVARQIVAELNAALAGRGAGFRFQLSLAEKADPAADVDRHLVVTDACGSA